MNKLGDFFTLQRGNTYKSALLGQPGPVLLGLGSIARNGGFKGDNLKTYGGLSDPRMLLAPGDIYVSLKDVTQAADLLGAVARVPSHVQQGRLTQDTVKLVFTTADVPKDYLYWLLQTPDYRAYCRAHSTGTTNLGLAREDFLAFPVPELTPVRQRIIDALQFAESKSELNRRMNETLEATAQAVFRDWFIDFGPVLRSVDGTTDPVAILGGLTSDRVLARELAALFPATLGDNDLPQGWTPSTVGSEFQLTMGQSPPGDTYNESGEGLPFFQGRTDFGFRFPERRKFCSSPSRVAKAGDTLISVRAPVGDLNVAWEGCCIGRGVAAARHISGGKSFTLYSLRELQPALQEFEHTGTVFGAINKKQFEALPVVRPPAAVVTAFEQLVGPMDELIRSTTDQSRTLAETRDYLLPRLMSSQVHVGQAAEIVSEVAA